MKKEKPEKTKLPYPQVWKNSKDNALAIVYRKRVEYYWAKQGMYITQVFKTPFGEIERLVGSGFKRVHYDSSSGGKP